MSKLKLLAATFLIAVMTSASYAGIGSGFRIGLGLANTDVNGSGSEVLRTGAGDETTMPGRRATGSGSGSTEVGHLFLELSMSLLIHSYIKQPKEVHHPRLKLQGPEVTDKIIF